MLTVKPIKMAENIILKARIAKMQMANPITEAAQLEGLVWEDLPITLRDDEIAIVEGEPTEDEVFSHENDAVEDYDIAGTGIKATGSFIKVTYEDLAKLLGGTKAGTSPNFKFHKSAKKLLLNKALRYELKGGGEIIIPNAKGYVLTNLSVGFGGKSKFPFKFAALPASSDWNCDIIW